MRFKVLAVVFVAGILGGCTNADWDHALSYAGVGEEANAPPAPQAAPAEQAAPAQQTASAGQAPAAQGAPAVNEWCAQVAAAAQRDAAENGFDAATQQHRAQSAYQQCNH